MSDRTDSFLKFIEDVITKKIVYHLFDDEVEFLGCVILSYLLALEITCSCFHDFIDKDLIDLVLPDVRRYVVVLTGYLIKGKLGSFVSFREMITSQLQGKLWLYDEVQYTLMMVSKQQQQQTNTGVESSCFPTDVIFGFHRGIILLILGGFAWYYTHVYIEDGVTFIAKGSLTFLAKRLPFADHRLIVLTEAMMILGRGRGIASELRKRSTLIAGREYVSLARSLAGHHLIVVANSVGSILFNKGLKYRRSHGDKPNISWEPLFMQSLNHQPFQGIRHLRCMLSISFWEKIYLMLQLRITDLSKSGLA
ncbi:hypothetical protein Tco_0878892 [Tanacetum coccineum]|uniref:Uncharacterized protein n=1 Tax=Tanacetum coccineum TaxID=301880 RepID=A0ABQ5BZK4_9ASTR